MAIKTNNMIFVFGSNLAGIHGAGAARWAFDNRGAKYGIGVGRTGQSYALPTKGGLVTHERSAIGGTLPLSTIQHYVDQFLEYAEQRPQFFFQVTCIGCGLAGLEHKDIAPMFEKAGFNCYFDTLWQPYLGHLVKYWGTF